MSLFGNRLFQKSQNSAPLPPKQETAPQPKSQGEGGYRTFSQLKASIKGTLNERLPGTGKTLDEKGKFGIIDKLQKRGQAAGQSYGISEQTWRERILPQMKKEEYELYAAGKVNEMKELQGEIQQIEKWIKGS